MFLHKNDFKINYLSRLIVSRYYFSLLFSILLFLFWQNNMRGHLTYTQLEPVYKIANGGIYFENLVLLLLFIYILQVVLCANLKHL